MSSIDRAVSQAFRVTVNGFKVAVFMITGHYLCLGYLSDMFRESVGLAFSYMS